MGKKIEFGNSTNTTLYVDDGIEITPYSRNVATNTTIYRVALTKSVKTQNKGDTNESNKD